MLLNSISAIALTSCAAPLYDKSIYSNNISIEAEKKGQTPRIYDYEKNTSRNVLIDVHCHIFNGQDLAISGFADSTIVEKTDNQFGDFLNSISWFLQEGVGNESLFTGTEIEYLSSTPIGAKLHPIFYKSRGRRHQFFGSLGLNLAPGVPRRPIEKTPIAVQRIEADETESSGPLALGSILTKPRASLALLLDDISARETRPLADGDTMKSPVLLTPALVDMTNWVQGKETWLGFAKAWAVRNSLDRVNRALVEGIFGLTFRSSTMREQLEVMKILSQRRPDGLLIHPFVAYDPWRGAVDLAAGRTDSALTEVQDAILNYGAIGVKLYPPMGYRPSYNYFPEDEGARLSYQQEFFLVSNEQIDHRKDFPNLKERKGLKASDFPKEFIVDIRRATQDIYQRMPNSEQDYKDRLLEPAYWLDKALHNFYSWCNSFRLSNGESNPIPIMAHTSPSHGGNGKPSYFERANPVFWGPILQRYTNFNFNLAHFGGVHNASHYDQNPELHYKDWYLSAYQMIRALNRSSVRNGEIFADLADVGLEPDSSTAPRSFAKNKIITGMRKSNMFDKYFDNYVMYGSDFPFTVMGGPVINYRENFENCMRYELKKSDDVIEGLMWKNAARFLGLIDQSSPTVQRLKNFHFQAIGTSATIELNNRETIVENLFVPFLVNKSKSPIATHRNKRKART